MANNKVETSPQVYARVGGMAYLFIIIAGMFGEAYVRGTMVVSGDAAATAGNIMNSPLLWRLGIAGDLLMHVCDVIVVWAVYLLLRPVNKNLALLAMLFNMIQTAVLVLNKLNLMMPLFLMGNADYLKSFDQQQLHSLAYLAIKEHGYGFGIGLIYFGFSIIIVGYLLFRSGYFPKALGVMMAIAGVCYLFNSFAMIIAPSFADLIYPIVLIPGFIGELSFCLWLIVKGVNIKVWNEHQQQLAGPAV